MSEDQSSDRRPSDRRLEEIFGSELSPRPDPESGEERRPRDDEYLENRPPHHDDRPS
jgi:hypothetical protein